VIVGCGCWRGRGATTTALLAATALAADGSVPWLIEADPAGGVLAARLDLAHAGSGLERIAVPDASVDPSATADERFAAAAVDFAGARLVLAPGDPFRAWSCHVPRRPWGPLLRQLDGDVIVDLGTIRGGSPLAPLLAQLDAVLLVSGPDAASLAATLEWTELQGRVSPGDPGMPVDVVRVVVVDVPCAQPVAQADAQLELGERLAGWLPWAPDAIELVQRGAALTDRRLRRQPLVGAMLDLADRIRGWAASDVAA
jgi:MinD-like ATPase involved in chromosome partitioning or flagellar assembly